MLNLIRKQIIELQLDKGLNYYQVQQQIKRTLIYGRPERVIDLAAQQVAQVDDVPFAGLEVRDGVNGRCTRYAAIAEMPDKGVSACTPGSLQPRQVLKISKPFSSINFQLM